MSDPYVRRACLLIFHGLLEASSAQAAGVAEMESLVSWEYDREKEKRYDGKDDTEEDRPIFDARSVRMRIAPGE